MAALTGNRTAAREMSEGREGRRFSGGLFAAGGLVGALLASSCCILPLALALVGIGGAWLGALTALAPYQPYLVALAAAAIGLGFWNVYFRGAPACSPGGVCAGRATDRIVKTSLWLSSGIVLLSATVGLWAPLLY